MQGMTKTRQKTRQKRGGRGREEAVVVRKGRRRENSLPPPTYAAGGSYRHGLGGPWDCQTFARPSVALGFFIGNRPAIDPRAILSPPTVSTTHTNNRSRIKQIVLPTYLVRLRNYLKEFGNGEREEKLERFSDTSGAAGVPSFFFTAIESLSASIHPASLYTCLPTFVHLPHPEFSILLRIRINGFP